METNYSDDLNTMRADDHADVEPEGFDNLETSEEVAEYDEWLSYCHGRDWMDDPNLDGGHGSRIEPM
jgi:hypothetical protein